VGNEGVVGISLFMGGNTTPSAAVVQTAGDAYRLDGGKLLEEFNRAGLLQRLLLRYTQALMTQMSRPRPATGIIRWSSNCALAVADAGSISFERIGHDQELIASMLGVRREGITEAAGKLQRAGFNQLPRGHIAVLDRAGLEARVCECYAVVKAELNRLLCDVRYRQGGAVG